MPKTACPIVFYAIYKNAQNIKAKRRTGTQVKHSKVFINRIGKHPYIKINMLQFASTMHQKFTLKRHLLNEKMSYKIDQTRDCFSSLY